MKKSLRRILALFAALFLALAAGMTAAQAVTDFENAPEGAHYARGAVEPVCTLTSTAEESTVECTGTAIAGVGNTNATVTLAVTATFTGVCHNPGTNSKIVDPFTESETDTATEPLFPTKNGRLVVPELSATVASAEEFETNFTCPNENWDPEVTSSSISYTYSVTFDGFTEPVILITG